MHAVSGGLECLCPSRHTPAFLQQLYQVFFAVVRFQVRLPRPPDHTRFVDAVYADFSVRFELVLNAVQEDRSVLRSRLLSGGIDLHVQVLCRPRLFTVFIEIGELKPVGKFSGLDHFFRNRQVAGPLGALSVFQQRKFSHSFLCGVKQIHFAGQIRPGRIPDPDFHLNGISGFHGRAVIRESAYFHADFQLISFCFAFRAGRGRAAKNHQRQQQTNQRFFHFQPLLLPRKTKNPQIKFRKAP